MTKFLFIVIKLLNESYHLVILKNLLYFLHNTWEKREKQNKYFKLFLGISSLSMPVPVKCIKKSSSSLNLLNKFYVLNEWNYIDLANVRFKYVWHEMSNLSIILRAFYLKVNIRIRIRIREYWNWIFTSAFAFANVKNQTFATSLLHSRAKVWNHLG